MEQLTNEEIQKKREYFNSLKKGTFTISGENIKLHSGIYPPLIKDENNEIIQLPLNDHKKAFLKLNVSGTPNQTIDVIFVGGMNKFGKRMDRNVVPLITRDGKNSVNIPIEFGGAAIQFVLNLSGIQLGDEKAIEELEKKNIQANVEFEFLDTD